MPKYKRILLKLSGEALAGPQGQGLHADTIAEFAREIIDATNLGTQIGVVLGGGNIFRGLKGTSLGIERVKGDYMGMLATVINALAIQSILEHLGKKTLVLTSTFMEPYAQRYSRSKAIDALDNGQVVVFAGGTGNPFFTTDSAAALRAAEINADILLKGTNVEGVYDSDPRKNPNAKLLKEITFKTAIDKELRVMDITAFTLCQENNIPIIVFNIFKKGNILKILDGQNIGSLVH